MNRSPHPPAKEDVKRLVFTSGKVYYELAAKRAEMGAQQDIAIVRVEQVRSLARNTCLEIGWSVPLCKIAHYI